MSFTGAADAQTAIGFLSLPTIKGENPVPGERKEWCKDVRARLGTCGGTCLLTKELPPAMEHATTLWDLDTLCRRLFLSETEAILLLSHRVKR